MLPMVAIRQCPARNRRRALRNAHRFVNRSKEDAVQPVVGDRTRFDEVAYPDSPGNEATAAVIGSPWT